eukprot:TRINITY_DN190_c0_g1_i4.p1 TRINITY_DN190_c0_g1~~TRINITY_DN190_c0_g1_i4.p1  ORF type:complete len:920 (-),score=235.17 TRINITY_DN190_c0_g1_i4:117-2876(-)
MSRVDRLQSLLLSRLQLRAVIWRLVDWGPERTGILKRHPFILHIFLHFHVDLCRTHLQKAGYTELLEQESWKLSKGGKYFFTRNNTTLVAFGIGDKFDINNTGFKIVGAHTDSPVLKLAPASKLTTHNYHQCCVQIYGGGLWHTWFDRDLTLAGRIVHKDTEKGLYTSKLWHHQGPLLRIPNLAIHLRDANERNKLEPNTETHLRPVISQEVFRQLTIKETGITDDEGPITKKHFKGLISLISKETGIKAENIIDFDLSLLDNQPSGFLGLDEDFISSPRLDNLFSTFFALKALLTRENQASNKFIDIVCLFDHEEIGSLSAQGADSFLFLENLQRIFRVLAAAGGADGDAFERALARSFIISADMGHAIHPNYPEKHQVNHQPKINEGVVLKINVNQRYASDSISQSLLRVVAEKGKVPIQDFIVKNDSPCGTTIGPIIAAKTGVKTVDIGAPQLSMHSIRETCGTLDAYYYLNLFKTFFDEYETIPHDLLQHQTTRVDELNRRFTFCQFHETYLLSLIKTQNLYHARALHFSKNFPLSNKMIRMQTCFYQYTLRTTKANSNIQLTQHNLLHTNFLKMDTVDTTTTTTTIITTTPTARVKNPSEELDNEYYKMNDYQLADFNSFIAEIEEITKEYNPEEHDYEVIKNLDQIAHIYCFGAQHKKGKAKELWLNWANMRLELKINFAQPIDFEDHISTGKAFWHYRNKQDHPCMIIKVKYHDSSRMVEDDYLRKHFQFLEWMIEMGCREADRLGSKKVCVIYDRENFQSSTFHREAFNQMKQKMEVLIECFHHRVSSIYVLHANWWYRIMFGIFKTLVRSVVTEKVQMISHEDLLQHFDKKYLLKEHGGESDFEFKYPDKLYVFQELNNEDWPAVYQIFIDLIDMSYFCLPSSLSELFFLLMLSKRQRPRIARWMKVALF